MMTLHEQRDVIQAAIDGKRIEFTYEVLLFRQQGTWTTCNPNLTLFNFAHYDYRVKPEPREFWIYADGQPNDYNGHWFGIARSKPMGSTGIKVREVL